MSLRLLQHCNKRGRCRFIVAVISYSTIDNAIKTASRHNDSFAADEFLCAICNEANAAAKWHLLTILSCVVAESAKWDVWGALRRPNACGLCTKANSWKSLFIIAFAAVVARHYTVAARGLRFADLPGEPLVRVHVHNSRRLHAK